MWVSDVSVSDLGDGVFSVGDRVRADLSVYCWSRGTEVAIAYDDGTGWVNMFYGNCPGRGTHSFTSEFYLTGSSGVHRVRGMESWTGKNGMVCDSTDRYSDHDDLSFDVLPGSSPTTTLLSTCSGTALYQTTGLEVCSDQYSNTYSCNKSSDGKPNTQWFGLRTGMPKWIYGDLDSVKCISGLRARIHNSYKPQTMDIQVSNDTTNWYTVKPGWEVNEANTWVEVSFDEIKARYVRLLITSSRRSYCNMQEYEVLTRSST